jgi:putative transposase
MFCCEVLDDALQNFGRPEIFNTDQGSQFTSLAFTDRLITQGIAISMDGRGRALDNVFIERLWRSVKYENIYLMCYASPLALERGLRDYFEFYNNGGHISRLDYQTPWAVY